MAARSISTRKWARARLSSSACPFKSGIKSIRAILAPERPGTPRDDVAESGQKLHVPGSFGVKGVMDFIRGGKLPRRIREGDVSAESDLIRQFEPGLRV